jgi:hypothetical protein
MTAKQAAKVIRDDEEQADIITRIAYRRFKFESANAKFEALIDSMPRTQNREFIQAAWGMIRSAMRAGFVVGRQAERAVSKLGGAR